MRRFFLAMLSLVVVGALAGAGTSLAKKPGTTGTVTASPTSINFGRLPTGVWSDAVAITFTNNTNEDLYYGSADTFSIGVDSASLGSNTCQDVLTANGGSCTMDFSVSSCEKGHFSGYLDVNWSTSVAWPPDVAYTTSVKISGNAYGPVTCD